MQPTPPADLTPARCGSTAVHPPHPIDGSAPGVADCDGLMRRATDREIAQAQAWVVEHLGVVDPDVSLEARQEYEHALEVLIHANGGRWAEPAIDPSLAEEMRALLGVYTAVWDSTTVEPTSEQINAGYASLMSIEDSHAIDAALDALEPLLPRIRARLEGRPIPPTPDPLVVAVLDAAIVWRQMWADTTPSDLSAEERKVFAAVDAMLAARHNLRDTDTAALLNRSESPSGTERAGSVPLDTPEGSGGAKRLHRWGMWQLPVTPAADLADEATHERVARAIHEATWVGGTPVDTAWDVPHIRATAYKRAKAAIDAYRAGPSDLADDHEAAINALASALHLRIVQLPLNPSPDTVVSAALAWGDRLTTALNDAARDTLTQCELISDGGLSAEQEARSDAVNYASRIGITPEGSEPAAEEAAARAILNVAQLYEAYIRDGDVPDAPIIDETWAFAQGYAEAVRRLRDRDRYETWYARNSVDGDAPRPLFSPTSSNGLADYLEQTAPDPDDPWAHAEPIKREGSIEVVGILAPPQAGADIGHHGGEIYACGPTTSPDATPTDGSQP